MVRFVLHLLGAGFIANAAFMWFAPHAFYETVPGVAMMGPFNLHFIRDIALVFLVSGAALNWGAFANDRTAALFGAGWPCLHALFHIWIWIARGAPVDEVAIANLLAIQLPAWGALAAAWHFKPKGTGR